MRRPASLPRSGDDQGSPATGDRLQSPQALASSWIASMRSLFASNLGTGDER